MKKEEFLSKLRDGIKSIPEEEKEEVMSYYTEYLEDAKDEEKAIEELGGPNKVATQIRAEYLIKDYENQKETKKKEQVKEVRKNSSIMNLFIILLAIFAAPIALPLAIALFVILVTFVFVLGVLAVVAGVIFVAGILAGLGLFVKGLLSIFIAFPVAITLIGIGIVILTIDVIIFTLMIGIFKFLFGGIVKIVKRIIKR